MRAIIDQPAFLTEPIQILNFWYLRKNTLNIMDINVKARYIYNENLSHTLKKNLHKPILINFY